jgi:hypothetical protein
MDHLLCGIVGSLAARRSQARARSLSAGEMSSRIGPFLVLHKQSNQDCIVYVVRDKSMLQMSEEEKL